MHTHTEQFENTPVVQWSYIFPKVRVYVQAVCDNFKALCKIQILIFYGSFGLINSKTSCVKEISGSQPF